MASAGLALIVDALSKDHADYLTAGGVGFMIGDGYLNYAPEQVIEVYYSYRLFRALSISADFQYVKNPGYNADRGLFSKDPQEWNQTQQRQ